MEFVQQLTVISSPTSSRCAVIPEETWWLFSKLHGCLPLAELSALVEREEASRNEKRSFR